jgi:hypothetical protein
MSYASTSFTDVLKQVLFRAGLESDNPDPTRFPDLASLLNYRVRYTWEWCPWAFLRVTEKVVVPDAIVVEGAGSSQFNQLYLVRTGLVGGKKRYMVAGDFINPRVIEWSTSSQSWVISAGSGDAHYRSYDDVETPDLATTWLSDPDQFDVGLDPAPTVRKPTFHDFFTISDGRQVLTVATEDPTLISNPPLLRYSIINGGELQLGPEAPDTVWVMYVPAAPEWTIDGDVAIPRDLAPAAVELTYADYLDQDGQHGKSQAVAARGEFLLNEVALRYARMQTQPIVSVNRITPPRHY